MKRKRFPTGSRGSGKVLKDMGLEEVERMYLSVSARRSVK
jgi:hypothetical protein